jgi:hypothetical protein
MATSISRKLLKIPKKLTETPSDLPDFGPTEESVASSAVAAFQRWQQHPVEFAQHILRAGLWNRQEEILNSVWTNKKTAVKSGHKVGKTYLLGVTALTYLFLVRPSVVITTAPTWRQVEKQLWQEIKALVNKVKGYGPPLGGELLETQYKLGDKHFAFGFSSEHGQSGVNFQGFSGPILFIFDEAGGVPQAVWDVVETSMVHSQSRWLCMGNPHDPATPFYNCFSSKFWTKFTVSSRETPNALAGKELVPGLATREWCDERLEEWGPDDPRYQFRVLGEFPDGGIFTLIRTAWVRAAMMKDRPAYVDGKVPYRAGAVDVARFGDDDTCIVGFEGTHLDSIDQVHGSDTVNVAGLVARKYKERGWNGVVVDDTGVGGGVTDILCRDPSINVIPVNYGESAADDDHYCNIITEMYAVFADELKDGLISGIPKNEIVLREFVARKYKFDMKQRMKLQPKSEFKEEVGSSPDRADAIVMARWAVRMAANGESYLGQIFV